MSPGGNSFFCRWCNKPFPTRTALERHHGKARSCTAKRWNHLAAQSKHTHDQRFNPLNLQIPLSTCAPRQASPSGHHTHGSEPGPSTTPDATPTASQSGAVADGEDRAAAGTSTELGSEAAPETRAPGQDEMEWEPDQSRGGERADTGADGRSTERASEEGENTPLHRPKARATRGRVTVEEYPDPCAGAPVRPEQFDVDAQDFAKHELANPRLFETAHWLGNLPISDDDRAEFFQHENNQHLPWRNHEEYNRTIDSIPHGPSWERQYVKIEGDDGTETYEMYTRNILAGVEYLLSNRKFMNHMRYSPEIHWLTRLTRGRRKQLYSEMWTARWWWRMQSLLKKGATVVPLIISTDKTQLSILSGGKKAWPVYLSIGNISKRVRRRPSQGAMILIAYLPIPDLSCVTNTTERSKKGWRIFHACMQVLLAPIEDIVRTGKDALCADGYIRRIHPILAAYIADFPEQCLVTCTRQNRCPVCTAPADNLSHMNIYPKRTKRQTLDAVEDERNNYKKTTQKDGVRPVWPFWADLPYVDIATCITPDLLHQLNKGVFLDHIVEWCTALLGEKEVDRRLKGMPRFQGLRHFKNGASVISQWTGNEAKQLGKTFLPLLAGCKEAEAVSAARSVTDFMYRAHMPELSDDDLDALDNDLAEFHVSKAIFEEKGLLKSGFDDIPKIHMLSHYTDSIRELGTTDGYNSETPERLHIDYVKDGWRMSNKLSPTEQMALYLQRKEAWALFRAYHRELGQLPASIRDRDAPMEDEGGGDEGDVECDVEAGVEAGVEGDIEVDVGSDIEGGMRGDDAGVAGGNKETSHRGENDPVWYPSPSMTFAKRPTLGRKPGSYLIDKHNATNLIPDVKAFLTTLSPQNARLRLEENHLFPVWTRFKLSHGQLPFLPSADPHFDHVRARPGKRDGAGRITRFDSFDTVLFVVNPSAHGLQRYEAGRIRAIFELPRHLTYVHANKLVYVEHFRPFSSTNPDPHRLHSTSHAMRNGTRKTSVIPLSLIHMACHLVPRYHLMDAEQRITSEDDLMDAFTQFFFNKYNTHFMFVLMEYWWRCRR